MYYIVKVTRVRKGNIQMGRDFEPIKNDQFEVVGEHIDLNEAKAEARKIAPKALARDADEIIICKAVASVRPVVDLVDIVDTVSPQFLTEDNGEK